MDLGVRSSGSITIIVPQSGTYTYYCTIHGANAMSGTLIVQ
jgi:plastocyanin